MHYHGTPITPVHAYRFLGGRNFCVSFTRPDDVEIAHKVGQSVMLDNGAFSLWRSGKPTNWPGYYQWAEEWLRHPTTWAVIPDVIAAGPEEQDQLIEQWPHGHRGAPVWHMHEPIKRLLDLIVIWPKVCIGSSAEFSRVMSPAWRQRMDAVWAEIIRVFGSVPWIHMLRGMQCVKHGWPFASVDSTDVARNHNRGVRPDHMAERWDGMQCPAVWKR